MKPDFFFSSNGVDEWILLYMVNELPLIYFVLVKLVPCWSIVFIHPKYRPRDTFDEGPQHAFEGWQEPKCIPRYIRL